jgi:hypothetical protein
MRITKILPLAFGMLLTIGASSVIGTAPCSTSAPCYTVANRVDSAGLAIGFSNVKAVYMNGRPLLKGTKAEYHVEMRANHTQMVIVHMPPNITTEPEIFQIFAEK